MIFAVSEDAICVAALGIVVSVDLNEMRHVVKGVGKRLNVCKRGSEAFIGVPLLNREMLMAKPASARSFQIC